MIRVIQIDKKSINLVVKPILNEFGLRGTLSSPFPNKLVLTISRGEIDFIDNFKKVKNLVADRGYLNMSEHYYQDCFDGQALTALRKLFAALKSRNWHDFCDFFRDFTDPTYFIEIKIGTPEKPYQFIGKTSPFSSITNLELCSEVEGISVAFKRLKEVAPITDLDPSLLDNISSFVKQLSAEVQTRATLH